MTQKINKFLLFTLLAISTISCTDLQKEDSPQTIEIDNAKVGSTYIKKIDIDSQKEEFSLQLKNHKTTDLPYDIQSHIFLPKNDIKKNKYDSIFKISHKEVAHLQSTDIFFNLIDVKGLNTVLYEDIELVDTTWKALLIDRFKPINDSIEVLLMSSNLSSSQNIIWFVATYDNKNNKNIDNTIVAVFETFDDTYFESYLKIKNDYSIKSIISSSYESNPEYTETHYQVCPNGKIKELLKQDYSYGNEYNLLSYKKNNSGYSVRFYDDFDEDGTPNFDLKYYKNNKIDSTHTLNKPITLFDNQERKWLTVYKYDVINSWRKDFHYKRYFYNKDVLLDHIQEVKCHYENDSVVSIAFKNAKSDIELNEKQFIKFDYYQYGHTLFEPWSNSIFDLNSYKDVKTKLTYLK